MLTTARHPRTAPTRATVTRHINAPIDAVFSLLADVQSWPRWGPFTATGTPAHDQPNRRTEGHVDQTTDDQATHHCTPHP